jgi:hypothetical protein
MFESAFWTSVDGMPKALNHANQDLIPTRIPRSREIPVTGKIGIFGKLNPIANIGISGKLYHRR